MGKIEDKIKQLELRNVSVAFGGVRALQGVDLEVREGECVALMGPNGAGKSTVLKVLFGLVDNFSGEIYWKGERVVPVPYKMTGFGVALVPQGRRVFRTLSVLENLEVGYKSSKLEEVLDFFPNLKRKGNKMAGVLSGGEQQMLALARALMADPELLLLDEPTLGLAPKVVGEVFEKIREIKEKYKKTVLLVEHNIRTALRVCDRVYVLVQGRVVKETKASVLMRSEEFESILVGDLDS